MHFGSLGAQRYPTSGSRDSWSSEEYGSQERADSLGSLQDLAQWAFGPQGLRSLELVVAGDFSCKRRFAHSQVFLCRHAGLSQSPEPDMAGRTFRHFSRYDRWQTEQLDKFSHILAACSTFLLFED